MPRLTTLEAVLAAIAQEMPSDPRKLKPGEVCRLLNSTPLGEVLTDRRLRAHRERAGLRIGDGKTIDLVRYAAWLFHERRRGRSIPPDGRPAVAAAEAYDRKRTRERDRNADASREGRDIGPIPEVAEPERRAEGAASFRRFCEIYFPERFRLAWSDDHLRVLERIETAVERGGRFALAMPRGSGKTTLCECGCLWAVMTGRRKFVMLIAANKDKADDLLDSLKAEIEANELLQADWPEVCYPVECLEGIVNRQKGQHVFGERTYLLWGTKQIVLPAVAGSPASGAIVRTSGLTGGGIRGAKFTRPADGLSVRPDLVVIDDPQTDVSAHSEPQCKRRERLLSGAVLGMAGPGQTIAAICPCTVIRPGDVADHLLDREQHPAWQGERFKLVYQFPADEKLWAEYADIRRASLQNGGDGSEATEFYREHRAAMDDGAAPAWPARHLPGELSAIQHAMNLRIDDEETFWAEYQNEPKIETEPDEALLPIEAIAGKVSGLGRRLAPLAAARVTGYIDVQQRALFWAVCAWADDFTGSVLDYGVFPAQAERHFTLRNLRRTLRDLYPTASVEGAIRSGLDALSAELLGREFPREDGGIMRLDQLLVDAQFQTETVYQFARESPHAALLLPSHGKPVGPAKKPYSEYRPGPGLKIGHYWLLSRGGRRAQRHLLIDTNYWKSFLHARLAQTHGDFGSFSLFGREGSTHRLLAEHLTAEKRARLTGPSGRTVDVWTLPPAKPDNHWFDCLVGNCAAASLLGCVLAAAGGGAKPKKRVRWSEVQAAKRGRR